MDASDVQALFLRRLGLRLGPEMSEYVRRRLAAGAPVSAPVAVMGGDARTGLPVRTFVDPAALVGSPGGGPAEPPIH